ncbi:hypothetical protein IEQ34_016244 [Dendrobium chrysotoxum]|uniref:Sugar phosphate transporter domain-containing protein n=1 Tax=Dendrobium chrysotoxum TaxID=161865 RepID=A0AAV7FX61_DENCH|nr:hypothetical protein IEQ34_016244 [Dendrobium chrysotoxum]
MSLGFLYQIMGLLLETFGIRFPLFSLEFEEFWGCLDSSLLPINMRCFGEEWVVENCLAKPLNLRVFFLEELESLFHLLSPLGKLASFSSFFSASNPFFSTQVSTPPVSFFWFRLYVFKAVLFIAGNLESNVKMMKRLAKTMITKQILLTYLYLLIYICLSSGVILYNKWVLSPKHFKFPFPITLTMIYMGFSAFVAVILVRVFKIVAPVKMTFQIYATCVIPISAFFASSLWFGNTAYLHISVAFIQMLKALMPVATFLVAVVCGTDKLRCDLFLNMLLVSVGVVVSSYGEIHFNAIGTVYQVTGIFAEALRLVLTQVLLQKKGLTLNPITSLYYIAPCSFVFLFVPWYLLEKPEMDISQIQFNFRIFFTNALCALALNFSIFLVIGRTGAVTIRVAGVLKDWILIALSTIVFPESTITGLNIIGYAIANILSFSALLGVVIYNYLKVKDVRASSQLSMESISERATKDWKLDKKSSDIYREDDKINNNGGGGNIKGPASALETAVDEEAPLLPGPRVLSYIGRSLLGNHAA